MRYSEIKRRIVNPGGRVFLRHPKRYAICNEFGPIAFVWAENAMDALDEAVDSGHMDCMAMSDADYAEYAANGWDDSYILAGNASEQFWAEYLSIWEI